MQFITVSRQAGSAGDDIAKLLAEKLNIPHINRDFALKKWFPEIATRHELHMLSESPGFFHRKSSSGITFQDFLEKKLKDFIADQSAVISGMGAQIIFQDHPQALHVRVIGSMDSRVSRLMEINRITEDDARKIIEITDRRHRKYIQLMYNRDWADPLMYDLILNTDKMSVISYVSLLEHYMENNTDSKFEESEETSKHHIIFKNRSEEEFAKVLDLYNLEWEYEPRTFPLQWDSEGNITQAFSPDFYLPRFNTYIELTIMNQKYTATKKKKMALLKRIYPDVNISIVYKSDYHSLVKRFAEWGE